ncbi:MAG TPA: hypothetical protein VGI71_12070 [Scandinavium sp.]|jgi:hypothetical protein
MTDTYNTILTVLDQYSVNFHIPMLESVLLLQDEPTRANLNAALHQCDLTEVRGEVIIDILERLCNREYASITPDEVDKVRYEMAELSVSLNSCVVDCATMAEVIKAEEREARKISKCE